MASRRYAHAALLAAAAGLILAQAAASVILATTTGTENTSAPPDDPGWDNLGTPLSGNTAIYLGGGWVLTAGHVGLSNVLLGGSEIEFVPGTEIQLGNSPGVLADVKLFRILSDPGLPDLTVSSLTPPVGGEVVMIGRGKNRGTATTYDPPGPGPSYDGWLWGGGQTMRWGTNLVTAVLFDVTIGGRTTRSFETTFEIGPPLTTDFEAQGANGDSGGAVFYDRPGGDWELVGVIHSISGWPGQPPNAALDGNATFSADLAHFAADIAGITAERACSDGSDDDGDGLIDHPDDPGCDSPTDPFETDASMPCDDGYDDDGDGMRDSFDPGCRHPSWPQEDPACDDGADNDGDTYVDASGGPGGEPADPQCKGDAWRTSEKASGGGGSCGLGVELALLVPLLARLRRRHRA